VLAQGFRRGRRGRRRRLYRRRQGHGWPGRGGGPRETKVRQAEAKVEKAKASLQKANDGLVTAKAGLKEAKAAEKARSPKAQAAAKKAAEKPPADAAAHVESTRSMYERAGSLTFKEDEAEAHVARLGKELNKAQAQEVARGIGMKVNPSTSKKAALEMVRQRIVGRTGALKRSTMVPEG
jgi:hypothetical protein